MFTPGSVHGLSLRVAQVALSVASITLFIRTKYFQAKPTAFWALAFSMMVQALWSFALGCYDIYSLRTHNNIIHSRGRLLVVFGWGVIVATADYGAAAASAAILEYVSYVCWTFPECPMYTILVSCAFCAAFLEAVSCACVLWRAALAG